MHVCARRGCTPAIYQAVVVVPSYNFTQQASKFLLSRIVGLTGVESACMYVPGEDTHQ
jgi:hypothetical protein